MIGAGIVKPSKLRPAAANITAMLRSLTKSRVSSTLATATSPPALSPTAALHRPPRGPTDEAEAAAAAEAKGTGGGGAAAEVQAELDAWVAYGPRALALLRRLSEVRLDVPTFQQSGLGRSVRRYASLHPDAAVAALAKQLIEGWKRSMRAAPAPPAQGQRAPPPASRELRRKRAASTAVDDDETSSEEESSGEESGGGGSHESEIEVSMDSKLAAAANGGGTGDEGGWKETVKVQKHRARTERFRIFTFRQPFKCGAFVISIRVSEACGQDLAECKELLSQMAVDFGAMAPTADSVKAGEKPVLERLKRLEERFRGSGVTEGEARNAMRLFERELSKANWTEDKFAKMKRQLAGVEGWSAADTVAEGSLIWTEPCKRRLAWFSDACERVAMPLGIEFGYAGNGGCCFAGPLSSVAGAALTSTLVCHFAQLDFERARQGRGGSKTSAPQFLQGFVDGSLTQDRHLVWEKVFSIEDDSEAASFCEEALKKGFFDGADDATTGAASGASSMAFDEGDADADPCVVDDDLQSMLRGLFSGGGGGGGREASSASAAASDATPSAASEPARRGARHRDPLISEYRPAPPAGASVAAAAAQALLGSLGQPQASSPQTFQPFAGKPHRLGGDSDDEPLAAASAAAAGGVAVGRGAAAGAGASSSSSGRALGIGPGCGGGAASGASSSQESGARGGNAWALTFVSNVQLVRASRQRSREEARKTYHWTYSAKAVKATKKGTESYSQGRQAGEKRKGEIDGTARSAKQKFCKGGRRAITQ
mmetsp:Transcript_68986/g.224890  ORF Transcript_68986/g.224890 Transcript_68986/m.224890 type:complete len:771 (+) Transcript_68986:1299-3611(+)